MCGIVGAIAQRNVSPILVEGLRRLEYRGYDSAGVALVVDGAIARRRAVGKVAALAATLDQAPLDSALGIAHTRWATHGVPAERNSHPHTSRTVAVVHNGIIENHEALREELRTAGFDFQSETDTEVVAHLLQQRVDSGDSLREALRTVLPRLQGAYALAVVDSGSPGRLLLARKGSPLVIGVGIGEHFAASDALALLPVFTLLLGIGELSKVSIVAFAAFFPVLLNTVAGVRTVDPLLVRAARTLGLSNLQLFVRVVLPSAVPTIFTGVRMAGTASILVLIAAEMVGAKAGLGYLIVNAQSSFQIPQMYAGILTVSIFGLVVNTALVRLERRFSGWRTTPHGN